LTLEGDANDYFAKGMSGGRSVIYPPVGSTFEAETTTIVGNVVLYGATGGEVYIRGLAGERFAVRNSGARAVVEGIGDHGCEYMTGGIVAVLGPTGRNFAAGMSGGIAYVLDETGDFMARCNLEMVGLESVVHKDDEDVLRKMIHEHLSYTGSLSAKKILADWNQQVKKFVKVMPHDYKRIIEQRKERDSNSEMVKIG